MNDWLRDDDPPCEHTRADGWIGLASLIAAAAIEIAFAGWLQHLIGGAQ